MDAKQQWKLTRYIRNSTRFLWGLSKGKNQRETYEWLKQHGNYLWGQDFDFIKGNYAFVLDQLLTVIPGTERLIKDLIIPRVHDKYSTEELNYLRECWLRGQRPEYIYITIPVQYERHLFININTQYKFVEEWTTFAGIWFEEIEPLSSVENSKANDTVNSI